MQWITCITECSSTNILIAVISVLGLFLLVRSRKAKNFPPGPCGLPIVGYTPFFGSHGAEKLRTMKEKCGPVMSLQMGMQYWVVLNDYTVINEALVKQGDIFSGRPSTYMLDLLRGHCGVILADHGPAWHSLRKFGLTTLRGFGVGKKGMENNVMEEVPYLVGSLMANNGQSAELKLTFSVSNIICRVVFGSRYTYDDKRFSTIVTLVRDFFSEGSSDAKMLGLMTAAPILRFIPPFRGCLKGILEQVDILMGTLREIVSEHRATFNENDIRDFIDAFLKEMKDRGEDDESFCEKQLLQYIRDLFEAGTGTTSSTLNWALLAFLNYPDSQERIAKEVHDLLGDSGIPTMKHREEMPYTCAFIQELMRHRTLAPVAVFHKTNADTTLNGFSIPKDTTVIPNLWAVHFDPCLFHNAEQFRPERFLDHDGKFIKSNHVIPFSVGPRYCLGEQLAKMEIFIFLTGIVQRLKVLPDPQNPPPPLNSGSYNMLLTFEAPKFKVVFEKR